MSRFAPASQVVDGNYRDVLNCVLVERSRTYGAVLSRPEDGEPMSMLPPPGQRLPSHPDPTCDEATSEQRNPTPSGSFQCTKCHATGSATDEATWPELAGRRVHIHRRVVVDEAKAVFGVVGYVEDRRLCGLARTISR